MDWSKHKFFVGLYDEDDGSIDSMVWMMNRSYYQRRWTVFDNVSATDGAAVVADADYYSAIAVDSDDFDRLHVCKSVRLMFSILPLSDMDPFASAAAKSQSKHEFLVAIEWQQSDNDFWNIAAMVGGDGFGGDGAAVVVADDDHSFGRHAIA